MYTLNKVNMFQLKNKLKQWCESMRVEDTEFYKMCQHAYCNESLDATTLAYDLQNMLEIKMSEDLFVKRKKFLDSFQIGTNGFFYERSAEEALKKSSINRALEMHGNYLTFQTIGAYKSIKKLPENIITFYDQYASDIERYLSKNCPWERSPWGAGGMVDNLGTILKCNIDMGYHNYKVVIDEIIDWLDKHQDNETGLWTNRENTQGINGLVNGGYHLMRGTYFLFSRPFNKVERIIDTILEDIKSHPMFSDNMAHGCNDLDHFFLLHKCHECIPTYRKEEIIDLVAHRREIILQHLLCDDGGFSFWINGAVKVHNYFEVSPGYKEGDMQGTVFYIQTLNSMNRIIGEEVIFRESMTHGA